MRPRFALILLATLAILGAITWTFVSMNQRGLVTLQGSILKVRTYALSPRATLVFADFRITNPADIPFVVGSVEMFLDRPGAEPISGGILSRDEVNLVFQYQKIAGPKYNEPLIVNNRIQPGETIDRMSAARFELLASEIESRTSIRLRIHELDGQVAEIKEKLQPK